MVNQRFCSTVANIGWLIIGWCLVAMQGDVWADTFSELTGSQQLKVEQLCAPRQYSDGDASYRECIIQQSQALLAQSNQADSFSFDEQVAIQQTCRRLGELGSAAYQNCSAEQARSLADLPEPRISALPSNERYAIQQACFSLQQNAGVRAYRQCVLDQVATLNDLPIPDLSALTPAQSNALQTQCSNAYSSPNNYRQCLLNAEGVTAQPVQIETITAVEEPIAALNTVDNVVNPESSTDSNTNASDSTNPENSLISQETVPTATTSTSANDENAETLIDTNDLTAATEIASDLPSPTVDSSTETDAGIAAPVTAESTALIQDSGSSSVESVLEEATTIANESNGAAEEGLPSSVDNASLTLVAEDEGTGSEDAQTVSPTANQQPANPLENLNIDAILSAARSQWDQLRNRFDGLEPTIQRVLLAALALPILLLLFWLVFRKKQTSFTEEQPLRVHQRHELQDDELDFTAEPPGTSAPRDDATSRRQNEFEDEMNEFIADETLAIETGAHRAWTLDSADSEERFTATEISQDVEQLIDNTPTQPVAVDKPDVSPERLGMALWLNQQPQEERLSLAIEFMIYWTAYADERYEPGLRKKIFTLTDPDEHELIKRWVLKQDTVAFAAVISWLQNHCDEAQRTQIIVLLMALLINEQALTPAQNTLLRFLADVFGLGAEKLDALYHQGYGEPMPQLPRADKPQWWEQQSMDNLKRWDARSVARQSTQIQHRVKLGLPLNGSISTEQIDDHFQRAALRCHPNRFDQLGSREQYLAEQQLSKFEQARLELMEMYA